MKVRKDFVTNSSSSSFVIGKKNDESVTLDSVFQTIKEFYKEYLAKRDAVIQYITDNPELGMVYQKTESGEYYCFKFLKGQIWDERNYAICNAIERDFGISIWDCFEKDYDWLECQTYQDYENYWLKKMNVTDDCKIHAPFTIADFFEEKEINWLHYNKSVKEIHYVNSKSDILAWYYSYYIEAAFENIESCDTCNSCSCNIDECEQQKTFLKSKDVPEEKACLYLLGRICVYSEDCYIPYYVVEKLSEISEYSCNHMG